jgi:hypothetical protein
VPSDDCPWLDYAACRALVTAWSRRPGWYAGFDYVTEEFIFHVPGEAEARRFKPVVVLTDGGPTQVWAVRPLARL